MPSFTDVFGGQNIFPSQLTLLSIALSSDITLQWPIEQALPDANVFANILDVTPTAAHSITMPDATLAGNGQSVLVNNLGSFTVTIKNALGGTIGAVPSGEVWQFYLEDNTTIAGTWRTFQFGTGASSATAAALAGAGLKAISTTLNEKILPEDVGPATPYVVLDSDRAKAKRWTGGVGTFNLPNPATVGADWFFWARNSGTGTLTLSTAFGYINTIGVTTKTVAVGSSTLVVSDGTNWFTMADGAGSSGAFDYTSINVAGAAGDYTLTGNELNRIAYQFTGALTGNRNIVVPVTVQQYWVHNNTSGAFTLTVKTAAGTGIAIPQGGATIVYSDGINVVAGVDTVGLGAASHASGDFLGTYTGFTAGHTDTLHWYRTGNIVVLELEDFIGTSNANSFTITGLPPEIVPAETVTTVVAIFDNTVAVYGNVQIPQSGNVINFSVGAAANAFTAAGSKGLSLPTVLVYPVTVSGP